MNKLCFCAKNSRAEPNFLHLTKGQTEKVEKFGFQTDEDDFSRSLTGYCHESFTGNPARSSLILAEENIPQMVCPPVGEPPHRTHHVMEGGFTQNSPNDYSPGRTVRGGAYRYSDQRGFGDLAAFQPQMRPRISEQDRCPFIPDMSGQPQANLERALPAEFIAMSEMQWPLGYEVDIRSATTIRYRDVKDSLLRFKGDITSYPAFKAYFVSQVHLNIDLTMFQRSLLLKEMLGKEPTSLVCPKTTNSVAVYKRMLCDLDGFYSVRLEDAFGKKIIDLEQFSLRSPSTLPDMIEVFRQAYTALGLSSSALMPTALEKVGH